MFKKLKSYILDDTVYTAVLLVLVGVGSFGLGRMGLVSPAIQSASVIQSAGFLASSSEKTLSATNSTQILSEQINPGAPAEVTTGSYVASKSGTKYHKITCGGAKNIKDANKIYFASEAEAQSAGYTRAANCKF